MRFLLVALIALMPSAASAAALQNAPPAKDSASPALVKCKQAKAQ